MRRFYEQALWILQHFLLTNPDLHHGLLTRSFLRQSPNNPADEFGHGSGVASLVAYYALNIAVGGTNRAHVWVAGARILDAHNKLEDERLFSKLIREVVEYYQPLGVRIFNLSINDLHLGWNQAAKTTVPRRSWTARTIDRLSREFDVVFVISTGNLHPVDVTGFIRDGNEYPAYLGSDETSLRDPGQAALAVTVGSAAPSTLLAGPHGRARAIAETNHPSPFTRTGPGIRKEVKPEIVDYGGNYLFQEELRRVQENPGLKIPVANNQITPAISYSTGTSFAAARVSHKLGRLLADLSAAGVHPNAPLLKAFLVNSALYRLEPAELEAIKRELGGVNRRGWLNAVGYGVADAQRATDCDDHVAILYHQGEISADSILFFDVPVPAALEDAPRGAKRLTVTMAHYPEVQRWGLEEYLGTVVKWRMFRGDVPREQIVTTMSEGDPEGESNEADQPEPEFPNELPFAIGLNLRSRGTVQHDWHEWTTHRPEFSANHYTLAVVAYERWSRANPPPVPFAVVVKLEETSRTVSVYSEIRAAIEALRVPIQVRG